MNNEKRFLTKEEIREKAPVVYQTEAHEDRSDKYSLIPTSTLINDLSKLNWNVVDAVQTRSKKRNGYQKHMVSFENPDVSLREIGDSKPRIVITNSFDGLSSFKMQYGIFRLVCENGMVVAQKMYKNLDIIHKSYTMTEVEKGVYEYLGNLPQISEDISNYKETKLDAIQKLEFAEEAMKIRYPNVQNPEEYPLHAYDLLEVRRREDTHNDLYTVMNIVQENIIRAGMSARQRGRKVRGIRSIDGTININQALWALMNNYYKKIK